MSKTKKAKLSKIEEFKVQAQQIPSILQPINAAKANPFSLGVATVEQQPQATPSTGPKLGSLPDINAPVVSETKRSVIKISKRKIKVKKQDSHNLSFSAKK